MEDKNIVPHQTEGNYSGAEETVQASNHNEAIDLFLIAKKRLLDINNWHVYSGHSATTFLHLDKNGKPVLRKPETGDYIRIDLPGPGPREGDGYDWVRIEVVHISENKKQDDDYCAIRVRPAPAPGKERTAHFFTNAATSTFLVKRNGLTVTAAEKGRNEISNTESKSWFDKIRNKLFATGASYGLAHIQWQTLVKGLIRVKSEE